MFGNLNWYNVVVLVLLALFIFGDRLPKIIADAMRLLRNLRRMAQNATTDLSRELGTDIQLEDLNPKTFVRKHLISEADQEALVKPLKGISEDLVRQTRSIGDEVKEVGRSAKGAADDVKKATDLRPSRAAGSARSAAAGTPAAAPVEAAGTPAVAEPAVAVEPAAEADPVEAPPPRPRYDDVT